MNKWIPISLWILVTVLATWVIWQRMSQVDADGKGPKEISDGRVFIDVPWQHLPLVGDLGLTDQDGQKYSAASRTGKPMLVNFFFSTCPSICRQFNGQMKELSDQFKGTDVQFVSITVDPEKDDPELLKKYAASFDADESRWKFLTGQPYEIAQLGTMVFHVPLVKSTHTEKIILVDKWGKIRDWFDWNSTEEIRRLKETVREVLAESKPPIGQTIHTRYALAGGFADRWETQDHISEFKLLDTSGQQFYSRDMVGKVWLANFFFSTCPGICQAQNRHFASYQERLKEKGVSMISITTDPVTDTVIVLKDYARQFVDGDCDWRFLTGPAKLIRRVGQEFFRAAAGAGHHSSRVYVVDRWGNVRGDFDWQDAEQETEMWQLVDRLNNEVIPPLTLERIKGGQPQPALQVEEFEDELDQEDDNV